MKSPYHSAIKKIKIEQAIPVSRYENENICAMQFDFENSIANGFPNEFATADFIYLEPPFPRGYDTFNARANKAVGFGFGVLMQHVSKVMQTSGKPSFLIGDKSFAKHFSGNVKTHPIKLDIHNGDGILYYYNTEIPKLKSNLDLMDYLFSKYEIGLDFFCGYGMTGQYAIKHQKKAVLADINATCIGYIKENNHLWYENL